LIFITLPKVFILMPAPALVASMFFLLVLFAALTSAISLLEVVVAFVVDERAVGRSAATWTCGVVIFLLGVPSAVVSGFLDHVDALATNWLLPVGGLLISIFAGWVLMEKEAMQAYGGTRRDTYGFAAWRFCVRYVAPVAVSTILLQNTGLFG